MKAAGAAPVQTTSAAFTIYLGRFVMRVPVQKRGQKNDARAKECQNTIVFRS
jgi:hypothetical protein